MSGTNMNSSPYTQQKPQVPYSLNGQQYQPTPTSVNGNSNPPQNSYLPPTHPAQNSYVGQKQLPVGNVPSQSIQAGNNTSPRFSNVQGPNLNGPSVKPVVTSSPSFTNYATNFKTNAVTSSYGNLPPDNSISQTISSNTTPTSFSQTRVNSNMSQPMTNSNIPPPIVNSNVSQIMGNSNMPQPIVNSNISQPMRQPGIFNRDRYPNQANLQTVQNKFTNMSLNAAASPTQTSYAYNAPNSYVSHPAVSSTTGQSTNYLSNKPPNINATALPPNVSSTGMPSVHPPNANNVSTFANRYPVPKQLTSGVPGQNNMLRQPQSTPYYPQPTNQPYSQNNIVASGFNQSWNKQHIDLLQTPNILPPTQVEPPRIHLGDEQLNALNCSPDIIRCTLTKIPDNSSLLQKSRLPLGILIHPFRDLSHLPVIQCNVIVRCRSCRTYINPFVYFVDNKRWKCNICYRLNELPEEFQYDPVSKTYGDPSVRPEIKNSTIEYIAPAEYMMRPPQPAIYIFLLDISRLAVESGYLNVLCSVLVEELHHLPGDARTQVGFLAYDSALHFFLLSEGLSQPQEMIVLDVDDAFLPAPDGLLVSLKDRMEMIVDVLEQLPEKYKNTFDTNSALGAALQVAHKMISSTGGRITVFQAALPNVGPGGLTAREDPNQRASAEATQLNPANDFYKRLALECSSHQIAVDLFVLNSQYVDLATISGISRFSGGCIHHFPLFKSSNQLHSTGFRNSLRRYLLRKIGFEAVMRVRCTRGLAVHTFHGNFFVRSTDLLSLPNINPDSAFGLQIAVEESLADVQTVCFQAALLYTSSKGERRIRVHTMCLPVVSSLNDVLHSADQQAIIGLLAKMAVDRSMQSSMSDAREAFINVAVDILSSYKLSMNMGSTTELLVPDCLKLLPLFISAILKHPAFRIGVATRLDDRIKAMIDMKTKPLYLLMQQIYPDLYPIYNLEQTFGAAEGEAEVYPPKLHLSARCLENKGAFLMDCGEHMMIWIGGSAPQEVLNMFGVSDYSSIPEQFTEIPETDDPSNQRLHQFISYLNEDKAYPATVQVIRDDRKDRVLFLEKLIEDRLENSMSYHEFLQHLKVQIK